ncbi:UDP-N-acetylmuramate--L-alanine ligase [uncultured Thermanaerothrix sp.]|uniref:UDP-N-acetylmuramate--L-alanine ligase n=1 Tax=uncultured Thermanaerothrix sp. TaxID=1195149 RepID=UPI002629994A|nr:UDP-N-acetylmuramate--L-alanine ligase [uncultured Thermanaerothrix sp.]
MMKHVHFIGIGGSGLSAIARFLLERGYTVSGSDRVASTVTEQLANSGAFIHIGHHPDHIQGADVVVRSSAVPLDNPEVQAAQSQGIPILKREELLARLMENHTAIAVAGTHGKTTTTAMIAWGLTQLGLDPSYIVGSVIHGLFTNAHAGQGPHFVIEADEYDHMFLGLNPDMIVITNIEHDHPDCYPSPETYYTAFEAFARRLRPGGSLVACAENTGTARLANAMKTQGLPVWTYGSQPAEYQAVAERLNTEGGLTFEAIFVPSRGDSQMLARVSLQVPGRHNLLNALAALAVAHRLGIDTQAFADALSKYKGTARRFEVLGEARGIVVIDDYAHHPSEIRATLVAARSRYPRRRLWAVWQPHTYSRTQALLNDFAHAFSEADNVIVTEVYAARETDQSFSAAQVVQAMNHANARFIASLDSVTHYLQNHLQSGDVVIILSAGDANQVGYRLLQEWRSESEDPHVHPTL